MRFFTRQTELIYLILDIEKFATKKAKFKNYQISQNPKLNKLLQSIKRSQRKIIPKKNQNEWKFRNNFLRYHFDGAI
jgi:hypothetical protein